MIIIIKQYFIYCEIFSENANNFKQVLNESIHFLYNHERSSFVLH